MKNKFVYPSLIIKALEAASRWHEGQWRKDPKKKIPYISHPVSVGFLLQIAGYDEEVVAAGILHDVIEDCGIKENSLAKEFTPRVAQIVRDVSEPKKYSWNKRKEIYREHLRVSSTDALAVACADHIHNLKCILNSSKTNKGIWKMFHATKQEKMYHEIEVLKIIAKRIKTPLVKEYAEIISKLKK
ncbi:MAG: HD domain-containing protein [Patescibacteria group bacterium]